MAEAAGLRRIRREDPSEGRRRRLEMAKGSLFTMVKAVMSGRGAEPIDLVRTNLWR
jgi:hypothetical protein